MEHTVAFLRRGAVGRETVTIRVTDGLSLLEAAREAGLPIASACNAAALCARCGLIVLEGREALDPEREDERRQKERSRVPAEQRLACRAGVHGDVTATATYW